METEIQFSGNFKNWKNVILGLKSILHFHIKSHFVQLRKCFAKSCFLHWLCLNWAFKKSYLMVEAVESFHVFALYLFSSCVVGLGGGLSSAKMSILRYLVTATFFAQFYMI